MTAQVQSQLLLPPGWWAPSVEGPAIRCLSRQSYGVVVTCSMLHASPPVLQGLG